MAFEFDRYVNGVLMAEGVTIERQDNLADAAREAARIASRGPNGESPVLVLRPEALSRTGAVKVLPRPDAVSMTCGTICLEYEDHDRRDAAYDWLENHAYAPLSALEPAAPEGQQDDEPVAWHFLYEDPEHGSFEFFDTTPNPPQKWTSRSPLFSRPTEQAVTEAALRDAARRIVPYLRWTISDESPGHHPTMPSAVGAFMTAFGWGTEEKWREDQRAALKAAMEAGRHD